MELACVRMAGPFPDPWRLLRLGGSATSPKQINLKTWSTYKYRVPNRGHYRSDT